MPKTKKLSDSYEHKDDYQEDLSAHDNYIAEFDAYEAMLVSKTYDSVSRTVKSGITDGSAATIAIERAARVVGQLPSGVVKAAGKKDTGKGILMDIIRQKWIYPNANAQFPFFIKLRMWQLYSSVYGYMPMFYDWHVSPSGYIGPDCWLWSPRNFIPQAGRPSIADMDYVHAISYVSPRYLEELLDEDDDAGWDKTAIKQLLDDNKKTNREVDTSRDTFTARDRTSQSIRGQVALVTRYEAGKEGRWITFSPDGWRVIRDIPNPHKSAKIPFVIKPGIPLFDSFYNLGDFQRNKPLQFAMDGLTNFYFEGIKMNIFPPTIINANSVIKHTINMKPGAIWQELSPGSARRLETSTAGLSTYQSAMTQLKGALLNQAGTTDTAVNQEAALDPGFGKTPEALKMHQARESTRDNQDRTFLETSLEELIDGMLGLIPNIATENIPIDLFSEEIEEIIKQGYADVLEIVEEKEGKKVPKSKNNTASIFEVNESGESAKLTIKPSGLKNVHYKFNLDAQSTAKLDKEQQRQSLLDFLKLVGQFQNELMELRQEGKGLRWEHIFNAYGLLSDVPELQEVFGEVDVPQQQPEQQQGQPPQTSSPIQPMTVAGQQFNDPNLGAMAQQLAEQGGVQ